MKKITLFLSMAAVSILALGMGGCSKEKHALPEGEPCRLVLSAKTLKVETKAGTEPMPDNMEIGVNIVDRTSGEDLKNAALTNIKHVSDSLGAIGNANPDPIILTTGYTYDVYAYSPYDQGVTAETSSSIPVFHGTDVLWAKAAGEKPNASTHNTELVFEHRTAQISFKPVADPSSNPDLTGARVSVTGFKGWGSLDLATGKVTVDTRSHAVQFVGNDEYFCFLQNDGPMTLYVTVEIPAGPNAGIYNGSITEVFEPGVAYEVTVTVTDRNSPLSMQGKMTQWVSKHNEITVAPN